MSPNWLNVAGCDVLSTEGAKVSNLFDIKQHNRYFTDYRNQNKSSQKMRKFQLCLILDNTKDILATTSGYP
jgi:phosphopantothenoylcysteine synthetase/decarboxylase